MYDWYAVHGQQNRARPSSNVSVSVPQQRYWTNLMLLRVTWKK
jgi:hypothetical protein